MKTTKTEPQSTDSLLAVLGAPFRWAICATVASLAIALGSLFETEAQIDAATGRRNFAGHVGIAIGLLFGCAMSWLFGVWTGVFCAILGSGWLAKYMRSDVGIARPKSV
jgi:hypothetical protein